MPSGHRLFPKPSAMATGTRRRRPIRAAGVLAAAATILHASMTQTAHVHGFAPSSTPKARRFVEKSIIASSSRRNAWEVSSAAPRSSSCLHSTNDSNNGGSDNDEAKRLREKAGQYRAEAEKLGLTLGLKKIDDLERDIRGFAKERERNNEGDPAPAVLSKREGEKLQELKDRVEALVRGSLAQEEAERLLAGLASFASEPEAASASSGATATPSRLTEEEIEAAVRFVATLSVPVRDTLSKAAGYPDYDSVIDAEELIRNLHANRDVSLEKLRRLYGDSFLNKLPSSGIVVEVEDEQGEKYGFDKIDSKMLLDRLEEEMGKGTRAMDLFPRSVQEAEEGLLPSEEDADAVFASLERNVYMATERPQRVDGGYIVRGVNRRGSAGALLDTLDGALARRDPAWTERCQLSFVEIYSDENEELFEDALLITPNKFPVLSPRSLSGITTALSLFSSFVFCIDAFGENPVVMEKLRGAAELAQNGGLYDLTWFNDLLVPLLVTLGAAQGFHEAGHLVVAWLRQVKLTSPTILPALALPYLSFQNRLKTSPKGYVDLFDIAFAGPVAGLTVSFLALLYGLQLTTTVDPATAQLLPSLPVGFLTESTLGGTIVDLVLGGGDGILIGQDATTQVPLHPVAIGGFLGLLIHALDLVPIGSTDGGRMSQAVLGRVWHLTLSSLVFFSLLVASFTSDSRIVTGFLLVYSLTQRDMEIPCRNEIDKVELPRAVAALVSWILAALILVPSR